ncbi:hypothetical protein Ciccas_010355 [Cichlidogyrus casuarinus]|uniref:G-protein coupled receptors family 1 profile domain-containing protein n=1 Tax=Cichlidogyrus casuarinus TaxID=1844966 RepID=A0ABD2PUC0_9PLAT
MELDKVLEYEIINVTDPFQKMITHHFISVPACIVSIICIGITIIVALRRGLWRPTALYLITLAVVDLLALHLTLILSLEKWFFTSETIMHSLVPMIAEILDTFVLASNWITTSLAAERFVAICYPLKARKIRAFHRRNALIVQLVFCFFIKLPSIVMTACDTFFLDYQRFHLWFVKLGLMTLIPFFILAIVNTRLIHAVRRSSKFLKAPNQQEQQQQQMVYSEVTPFNSRLKWEDDRETIVKEKRKVKLGSCGLPCRSQTISTELVTMPTSNTQNGYSGSHYAIALTLHGPLANRRRRGFREERHITLTLICLIVVFFVFQGPFIILTLQRSTSIYNTSFGMTFDDGDSDHIYNIFKSIVYAALAIKPLCYFIIYCWFCQRFLAGFKALFYCVCLENCMLRHEKLKKRRSRIKEMRRTQNNLMLVQKPKSPVSIRMSDPQKHQQQPPPESSCNKKNAAIFYSAPNSYKSNSVGEACKNMIMKKLNSFSLDRPKMDNFEHDNKTCTLCSSNGGIHLKEFVMTDTQDNSNPDEEPLPSLFWPCDRAT